MKVHGITIDFNDIRTCGLLPKLCANWDRRSEELSEVEEISRYWDDNIKHLLKKTRKLIIGNMGSFSIVYSADENAILIIKNLFKELEISSMNYEDINHDEHYITHDYLKYYMED